jgi:hypothetical protein
MLQLPDGGSGNAHPSNYRGCRHAKELLRKKQKTPKSTTGRDFPTKVTIPGVSFAELLRGRADQQQPACQVVVAALGISQPRASAPLPHLNQQTTGQSVPAPNVNSLPLDNMLRVITVVQQIMTEFNGAVSEEDKIVAITKIVLNLIKQNGY